MATAISVYTPVKGELDRQSKEEEMAVLPTGPAHLSGGPP